MTQIEKIEAIEKYIFTGIHEELPLKIKQDIDNLSEEKRLNFWRNILEFTLPLLQRTTVRDTGDKPKITY
jgi:hypothetical protein